MQELKMEAIEIQKALVRALVKAKEYTHSKEAMYKMLSIRNVAILLTTNTWTKDRLSATAALSACEANEFDVALAIVETISAFAQAGNFDQALEISYKIPHESAKKTLLFKIAKMMVRKNEASKAIDLVNESNLTGSSNRMDFLTKLLIKYEVSRSVEDSSNSERLLDKAVEYAKSFQSTPEVSEALTMIIHTLLHFGQLDYALRLFDMIKDSRSTALGYILHALSIAGQEKRGMSLWLDELIKIHTSRTSIGSKKREDVLKLLSAGIPVISTIDQGQTLWRMYEEVVGV